MRGSLVYLLLSHSYFGDVNDVRKGMKHELFRDNVRVSFGLWINIAKNYPYNNGSTVSIPQILFSVGTTTYLYL